MYPRTLVNLLLFARRRKALSYFTHAYGTEAIMNLANQLYIAHHSNPLQVTV
jgi:hypothetical protein